VGQKHKGFLHTRRAETGYLLHTFNLLDAVLDSAADAKLRHFNPLCGVPENGSFLHNKLCRKQLFSAHPATDL